MKAPSKDFAKSVASQSQPGRGAESISVTKLKGSAQASMVVPGSGKVERAPGHAHERCASNYTDPMSRFGGK